LGLDGQKAAVQRFADERRAEVVREYVENETGKRSDRPELVWLAAVGLLISFGQGPR
jgi:hypothetical protein